MDLVCEGTVNQSSIRVQIQNKCINYWRVDEFDA